jgi:type IV pilus assembly protein PilV
MPLPSTNQRGFTLLEILVAIVVLSIGLLGLAGLQAVSLNNNQTAYYRSIATQQAYDMADRMRANQGTTAVGVRAGNYDNLPTTPAPTGSMALTDWTQWLANTTAMLPNGTGIVRCVSGPSGCVAPVANSNRVFDITVMWIEKGAVFNDPNCPALTPANTRCFVTRFTP